MKRTIWKIFMAILCAEMSMSMLSGCVEKQPSSSPEATLSNLSGTYAYVSKDIHNVYMQKVYEGFETACTEIGVDSIFKGADMPTSEKQIEIINQLVEQNVAGIAISANDSNALEPALQQAMNAGIKVISLDSPVNKESRLAHIQQANPEIIGRSLIRDAYDMIDGNGGIAILTSTPQASNQNLWIDYMKKELDENLEKYSSTPIITVVFGDDDATKSASEVQELIQNPNIKVVIAPTTVGILAAAEVIETANSDVKLTGLGFPSDMAPYIENGICESMYLWNAADIGYLAAYTLDALENNIIVGSINEKFEAGKLGTRSVTIDAEQGTEILMGDPVKFDISNINELKNLY